MSYGGHVRLTINFPVISAARMLKHIFIAIWLLFALPAANAATATITPSMTYQTIEGLGGATAFYAGWIKDHPYKMEIYTNAFAGLNLSMLRLGNWFRYTNGPDTAAFDIVSNANIVLGHSVPVYMSSWAPPAFLKSNGQVGNGGTLVMSNGVFAYTNFSQYWYDSLLSYRSNGVSPTWISIQNEPDWAASYDSCVFHPTEDTVNGTNYASYSKALDATFQKLTNLPSPPKILGPEVVHIHYNDLVSYASTMNASSFYGVNYHLYGGSTDGSPDGYAGDFQTSTNVFPTKPHFMTEYGYPDLMQTACLIHDCLTLGQDAGVNFWSLVWPVGGNGFINIENPYNLSSWTNAPAGVTTQSHGWWLAPSFWAMKHFSYFVTPGYRRINATDTDNNVRTSAFLSPDNLRIVVVLINTNATVSSAMTLGFGSYNIGRTAVYQTVGTNTYAGTNTFLPLGPLTNAQVLPPLSITTVVVDEFVAVGPAANPLPASGASGLALNTSLSWTPGNNAVSHAVYVGINSNAVAQATTASPEFQGVFSTTNFNPALAAGETNFWRVDEIAGANTNTGTVWSFSTAAPALSFVLNSSDALNSSSFNAAGNWVTNGTANPAANPPFSMAAYSTRSFTLRTPTTGDAAFGGASLTLSSGVGAGASSLQLKGPNGATVTITNLILSGGSIGQAVNSGAAGIEWVAGNVNVVSNSLVTGLGVANRYVGISANVSGSASISNDCYVIYSGNNSAFIGQLITGAGGALQVSDPINLGGAGAKLVFDNGNFVPAASLAIANPGGNIAINSGGATWQIGSGVTLTVSNPLVGPGNLTSTGAGVLRLAGTNLMTGNLVANGITLVMTPNASLKNSQLVATNGGTIDVSVLGTPLIISNRITLAGNLIAKINKSGFTSLLMASNVTYGGTLTVTNAGPALAYGDTIKLFSASNYSGVFSSIVPTTPGTGLLWNTNWLTVDGTIFVSSTNPALMMAPRIAAAQMNNGKLIISGTNGNAPGTYFYTLASTNISLPVSNWAIIATNQFSAGGSFNCTNNFDSGPRQQFFILRLP